LRVIRDASAGDAEAAALWQRIQTDFHANQRQIVESLKEKNALKRGLGVDRAADILWTLNHPATYWLLSDERGWSAAEYEQWLGDALCAELLEAPA
jgi:hypothetical protein